MIDSNTMSVVGGTRGRTGPRRGTSVRVPAIVWEVGTGRTGREGGFNGTETVGKIHESVF